jgi:hypothetical protein
MKNTRESYKYAEVPLTPAIAEELIVERFDGELAPRQTIVEEINHLHISLGGAPAGAVDVGRMIKKALRSLQDKDAAQNPSFGYWRIGPEVGDSKAEAAHPEEPSDEGEEPEGECESPPIADLVLRADSDGSGAVYLYYLPLYRLHAENGRWPCKIGRTDRDPLTRILSQAATALPEKPHVAMIVYTKHPLAFEAAIQGVLTLRGLKLDDSPGKEWFLTSPEEVRALVEFFDPRLKSERGGIANTDESLDPAQIGFGDFAITETETAPPQDR